MTMISLFEPTLKGNEGKYIQECLESGWISSVGSYVEKFEQNLAQYVDRQHAIAIVNGTSALHISLKACGIIEQNEVIVPTLTFVATVNAVAYCKAHPIFMDSDPRTLCLNIEKLDAFLKEETMIRKDGFTYNKKSGRKISAIIPVHLFGHPVDMDLLAPLCQKYNLQIIEDACESMGSEYKGKKTGSFGKVGCFSFNGNKIITTGGGGMVVTNDGLLAKKIKHLTTQAKIDSLEYDHDMIGYNYRLTNIQAALGVAQLEQLDRFITLKRENAHFYKKLFLNHDIELLWEEPWAKSNFWLYTIRIPKKNKNPLIHYLLSKNIQVRPLWKPIHTLPMYQSCETFKIEEAKEIYETCINIPSSVNLKKEDIEHVVKNIKEFIYG